MQLIIMIEVYIVNRRSSVQSSKRHKIRERMRLVDIVEYCVMLALVARLQSGWWLRQRVIEMRRVEIWQSISRRVARDFLYNN